MTRGQPVKGLRDPAIGRRSSRHFQNRTIAISGRANDGRGANGRKPPWFTTESHWTRRSRRRASDLRSRAAGYSTRGASRISVSSTGMTLTSLARCGWCGHDTMMQAIPESAGLLPFDWSSSADR